MGKEKSSVVILYNEADIQRASEVWANKVWAKNRKRSLIPVVIIVISLALAALLVMGGMIYEMINGGFLFPNTAYIALFGGGYYRSGEWRLVGGALFLIAILAAIMLFANARFGGESGAAKKIFNTEMQRRKSGFLPRELTFEENGVRTKGRNADFVIGYDEMKGCYEYSDGIFILMKAIGAYLWIPARFIDGESAEGVRNALKGAFGEDYSAVEPIILPEQTERPEKEPLTESEGDALIEFDIENKNSHLVQSMINALGTKKLLIMLLALAAVIVYGFFLYSELQKNSRLFIAGIHTTVFDFIVMLLTTVIPMLCVMAAALRILFQPIVNAFRNAGLTMKWNGRGVIYDNIIVRESPCGRSIIPWDKVDASVIRPEGLYIISREAGSLLIPTEEVRAKGEKLIDVINEQMKKHHHHDDDCCCEECEHEHEHEEIAAEEQK